MPQTNEDEAGLPTGEIELARSDARRAAVIRTDEEEDTDHHDERQAAGAAAQDEARLRAHHRAEVQRLSNDAQAAEEMARRMGGARVVALATAAHLEAEADSERSTPPPPPMLPFASEELPSVEVASAADELNGSRELSVTMARAWIVEDAATIEEDEEMELHRSVDVLESKIAAQHYRLPSDSDSDTVEEEVIVSQPSQTSVDIAALAQLEQSVEAGKIWIAATHYQLPADTVDTEDEQEAVVNQSNIIREPEVAKEASPPPAIDESPAVRIVTITPGVDHYQLIPRNSIDLQVHKILTSSEVREMSHELGAHAKWKAAQVGSTTEPYESDERQSSVLFLRDPLTGQLANCLFRNSNLCYTPMNHFEFAHAVRYSEGQHWRAHYSNFLTERNPRHIGVVLFLNSMPADAGGELRFPALGCQFTPKAGWAVIWRQCDRDGNRLVDSIMEECEVRRGTKYVAHVHIHDQAVTNGDASTPP